jgi:hypothetical protein
MSGNGPYNSRNGARTPPSNGKVQVLTYEHHFGRTLLDQLQELSPDGRRTITFIANALTGALHGVCRGVAPQPATNRSVNN